jgi:hypothetical protein
MGGYEEEEPSRAGQIHLGGKIRGQATNQGGGKISQGGGQFVSGAAGYEGQHRELEGRHAGHRGHRGGRQLMSLRDGQ